MKGLLNEMLRFLIGFGLRSYYQKIRIEGLEHIPKGKPILILPNHQNGLIDPILIGSLCKLNPYYLARADAFYHPLANWFLRSIQMLPIYRIRDGRNTLHKNEAIFDQCAELLLQSKNLMLFPEGSHGIDRRVRILKNGFIHIIDRALEQNPDLELQLLPIGFNYQHLEQYPDRVAIHIGKPISVQQLINEVSNEERISHIKSSLKAALVQLTTHIEDQKSYSEVFEYLHYKEVDFLNPEVNNELIASYHLQSKSYSIEKKPVKAYQKIARILLYTLNLPVVLFWKLVVKPKKFELEFISTYRYAVASLGYVFYMCFISLIALIVVPLNTVVIGIILHYLLSRLLVKLL